MRLGRKVFLILTGVFLIYVLSAYAAFSWLVFPFLGTLELELARVDADRALAEIADEAESIKSFTLDWAYWNDTYSFMQGQNDTYIDDNFPNSLLSKGDVNFMVFAATDGRVIYSTAVDEYANPMILEGITVDALPLDHPLLNSSEPDGGIKGIFMTRHAPAFVYSSPILTSDEKGPSVGRIVMGKFLDAGLQAELQERTRVKFRINPVREDPPPAEKLRIADTIETSTEGFALASLPVYGLIQRMGRRSVDTPLEYFHDEMDKSVLVVRGTLADISDTPVLIFSANVPRLLHSMGVGGAYLFFGLLVLLGLVMGLALLAWLHHAILRPLFKLKEHVQAIGQSATLSARLPFSGNDEIGELTQEYNHMLARLEEDAHKRLIAEVNLRESEARYRRILGTTPEGFWQLDREHRIVDVNDAMCRILGRRREETIGTASEHYFADECREMAVERRRHHQAEHDCFEVQLLHPVHEPLPYLLNSSAYCNAEGELDGRIAFFTDISDMKKAETLRDDIDRITRHDLKVPLNGIINFPRLIMKEHNLTQRQIEWLNYVQEAGYRMLHMINQSLNLYRMEKKTYNLVKQPVDLLEQFKRIESELKSEIEARELHFTYCIGNSDGSTDRFVVPGDELLCYSLLANLVKNAVEASPPKGEIRVALAEDPRGYRIAIGNAGVVPEEIRETLFDKYVTYGKIGGTGLGTYSARLIAETHGGGIEFTTSEADGTTLIVFLPRQERTLAPLSAA